MATRLSKFSVLKIEDDSDEEQQPLASALTKKGKNAKAMRKVTETSSEHVQRYPDGLIVHSVEKAKRKNGSKKKASQVEAFARDEGICTSSSVATEDDDKELKQAIEESRIYAEAQGLGSPAVSGTDQASKDLRDPLETVLGNANCTKDIYVSLLKDQLAKMKSELLLEREKAEKARLDAVKYKDRFRKVLSILQEAELMEKAQLIHAREQGTQIIEEISSQLKALQNENEKLRGRLSRYDKP